MKYISLNILLSFIVIALIHNISIAMIKVDDYTTLIDYIDNANYNNSTELAGHNVFNHSSEQQPLNINFQKGEANSLYKGGIYKFNIDSPQLLQKHSLYFKNFKYFEDEEIRKNSLLVIEIKSSLKKGQEITLPVMDTVIRGQLGSSIIYISQETKDEGYYVIDKQHEKASIRINGNVFAKDPNDFGVIYGKKTINPLPSNKYVQYIKKYTDKNGEIKKDSKHRKHQIKQMLEYAEARRKNIYCMTFVAATGSGKTHTMAMLARLEIVEMPRKKIIIITSRINLISQIREELFKQIPEIKILTSTDAGLDFKQIDVAAIDTDIYITTIQSFQKHYQKSVNKFDIIIFDEAHNLLSKKRSEMIENLKTHKKLQIIYFTATPSRLIAHKDTNLSSVYELSNEPADKHHITSYSIEDAINDRVNAPFQISFVKVNKIFKFKENNEDYDDKSVEDGLVESNIGEIVLHIYKNAKAGNNLLFGKKAIIFCPNIDYAESLKNYMNNQIELELLIKQSEGYRNNVVKYFESFADRKLKGTPLVNIWYIIYPRSRLKENEIVPKAGLKEAAHTFIKKYPYIFADTVHAGNSNYKLNSEESHARLLRYQLGGTIICGADKLMEGFDDPELEIGFFLKPIMTSNIYALQRAGRALRIDPKNEKKIAIIFEVIVALEQLLLSSPHLLGREFYGIENPLHIRVDDSSSLGYELISKINFAKFKSRKRKTIDTEQIKTKERKPKISPKPVDLQSLFALAECQTKELHGLTDKLSNFTLRDGVEDFDEYNDLVLRVNSFCKNQRKFSKNDVPMSEEMKQILTDLSKAVEPISNFFNFHNEPKNNKEKNFHQKISENSTLSNINQKNAARLKRIIRHGNKILACAREMIEKELLIEKPYNQEIKLDQSYSDIFRMPAIRNDLFNNMMELNEEDNEKNETYTLLMNKNNTHREIDEVEEEGVNNSITFFEDYFTDGNNIDFTATNSTENLETKTNQNKRKYIICHSPPPTEKPVSIKSNDSSYTFSFGPQVNTGPNRQYFSSCDDDNEFIIEDPFEKRSPDFFEGIEHYLYNVDRI